MVFEAFEENSSSQQGYLQGLNVDIYPVFVPCPSSKTVGNDGCEDAIEVEQEEEGSIIQLAGC